jgi:hypothetical protein
VVVGSMPCRLSSEIHVNEHRIVIPRMRDIDIGTVAAGNLEEAKPKHSKSISIEGREIVGPEYSVHACIDVRGMTSVEVQEIDHIKELVPQVKLANLEVASLGCSRNQEKGSVTS